MSKLICPIEKSEVDNFKQHSTQAKDYARLVLYISRKLIISPVEYARSDLDNTPKPFIMVEYGKTSRAYVFIGHNKYVSIAFPLHIKIEGNQVRLFTEGHDVEIGNKIISDALSIVNTMNGNGAFIDAYMNDSELNDNQALIWLEQLLLTEPSYIRYDDDEKAAKGKGLKHPAKHLDVNMSKKGTYKMGLYGKLTCKQFVDILNSETDCHFLSEYVDMQIINKMLLKKRITLNCKKAGKLKKKRKSRS